MSETSSAIKNLISESKKYREEMGSDIFECKKTEIKIASKIQSPESEKSIQSEKDFRTLRDSHVKLAHLILDYDKKIFEQNDRVLNTKKARSKSVHLYLDEKIEAFLDAESQKAETKWGLRKNAGMGSLIQKFIGNFIELKKREERQLKHIKKIIDDFRSNLVEFKKNSSDPNDYQNAERSNQKMKVLSNDLNILLSLLEFEDGSLKDCLGNDLHKWVEFVVRWKFHS